MGPAAVRPPGIRPPAIRARADRANPSVGAALAAYPGGVPVVTYTLWRLGLFAVTLAVLVWVGMGSWLAIVVAAVIAWALSYVLLGRQRDAAALHLAQRATPGRSAPADAEVEDAALDAAERERGTA